MLLAGEQTQNNILHPDHSGSLSRANDEASDVFKAQIKRRLMKRFHGLTRARYPWSCSHAITGDTYGLCGKCQTNDQVDRKNAARILMDAGCIFRFTYSFRPPETHS